MQQTMKTTDIKSKVAEKIASYGAGKVADVVITKLADLEITRRSDALFNGIKLAETAQRDLNKIKPDQAAFNADGSKASETFSKAKVEEKKKLEARLLKIEKAIETATESDNYSDLFNLGNAENDKPAIKDSGESESQ
jgi:hypothetical protein